MPLEIKTLDDIINDGLISIRVAQAEACLNIGSVNRDIAVESYVLQLRDLYLALRLFQDLTYLSKINGADLDNLGVNYAVERKYADYAAGEVFIILDRLNTTDYLTIPKGTIVYTDDTVPIKFETTEEYVFDGSKREEYRVLALGYSDELLTIENLNANYILRANIKAIVKGVSGNVNELKIKYIEDNRFKVINLDRTDDGIENETDGELRTRIGEKIAETVIGTEDEYNNIMLDNIHVDDSKQVYSGDLMERDTGLIQNDTVSTGLGCAGDFWIRGRNLYVIKEEKAFITDAEYLLGQPEIYGEFAKQPVWDIGSVVTSTGDYLIEGVNYELVDDIEQTDATVFANSVYGVDKIKFLSPIVTVSENVIRGGGDIDYVTHRISSVVSITEEREITEKLENLVAVGNNKITVQHIPIVSVISVYNATLNKYYIVKSFDASIGIITISNGGNLGLPYPRITDDVYVNYIYLKTFTEYVDFIKSKNIIIWLNEYGPNDTPGYGYGYSYGYELPYPLFGTYGDYGYDYQYGYGDAPDDTPIPGGTYKVEYSYLIEQNEIVTVYYTYNRLMADLMSEINEVRNLTADIVTKQALDIAIDISTSVTLKSNYVNQSNTIRTKIKGEIFNVLNNKLIGQIIYISDIINVIQPIEGVDNVIVTILKRSTSSSGLTNIDLEDNEYPVMGTTTITFV